MMKHYRITKYDPSKRNENGHYLYDHWTEFSDIGKTLEGEYVTKEMYLNVEHDYINAVIEILKENQLEHLRVVGYDQKNLNYSILENKEEWFHRFEYETINLFEDKKASLKDIETVCQMNFRHYGQVTLEINQVFYIHFGFDMYMYVGASNISDELINTLNTTSVFVEEFKSPYFSKKLAYTIQRSKKRSKYVLDEKLLENISSEQIKKVMNLSEEHPGKVHSKVDQRIANELGLETDFSKYEYFLSSYY